MNWVLWCLAALIVLLGLAASLEAIAEARDSVRFPPPGRMIDVGGRRLHILCMERGTQSGTGNDPAKEHDQIDRPTIIIEQGAGSPSILWWPIQTQVAAFARVCTYDRAGYLWSDPAPRTRSLEDRAADLHALLAAANIPGPYILVAHSFGGIVSRLYAHLHPEQIAGMVLVDTTEEAVILRPSYDDYVRKLGTFAAVLEAASRFGVVRAAAIFLRKIPNGLDANGFHALKALVVRPGFFRAMSDDPPSLAREPATLRSLSAPGSLGNMKLVVITHCLPFPGPAAVLEDGWLEGQHRLAALSTRGELVFAEHSNHMVQSDQPEIVVAAIRRVVEMRN